MPQCRHCNIRPAKRPRGLCSKCYYTPGLRLLYGPISKFGHRGTGISGPKVSARLPTPTHHPPGTPGKIAVMIERAAAGLLLFHPRDAGDPEELLE